MYDSSNREREIFTAALELTSVPARDIFLGEKCGGDASLRARIETLLRSHDKAGNFLVADKVESPSVGKTMMVSTLMVPVTEKAGDKIDRYRLLQQIGEGGCGVVYMAEQEEPMRRRVALKVIKLGLDTKQVIARFEAERQALALMDHPNIAKVLDAGATETGRPYFVMELVRGVRITDYCDQVKLSTKERLALFVQICQAIQHAHQKGIIHRDIKPSNILVTLHDGEPVPKVIDFGIAKATTNQRLTDKTLFTAFEQFMGTPAYMSPEQAEMSGLDIDTRSDIYALGVLLYELLTGKTPFDARELIDSGLDAMRKIIREKEPVRPSARLSTMADETLTTTAGLRQTEAPKLVHSVRGDLDWVVMKALEKDRTRRYETANGIAMDIQRHLRNEPIVARPPSSLYRFQKMIRRNRFVFVAAGAVAAALVLGLCFSSWQAIKASRAERQQSYLRREAEQARASASKERKTSEQRFYDMLIKQAQVVRREHRIGFREEAFSFLKQAHALDVPQNLATLRSEALACMGDIAGFTPIMISNFPTNTKAEISYVDPAGQTVGFVLSDGSLQLNRLPSGEKIDLLKTESPVWTFAFNATGGQIFSINRDTKSTWEASVAESRIWVWNRDPDGHWRESRNFSLPGAGNLFHTTKGVYASVEDFDKNLLDLVDLETMKVVLQIERVKEKNCLDVSPDGCYLAISSPDAIDAVFTIDIWDTRTGQLAKRLQPGLVGLNYTSFSPNAKYLSCLAFTGGAIYSLDNFERVTEITGRWWLDAGASFAANSTVIALPVDKTRIRLWDWVNNKDIAVLEPLEVAGGPDFGANDSLLVVRGNHEARVFQLVPTEKLNLPLHGVGESLVAFTPDNRSIAVHGGKGNVINYELRTGRKLWETTPDKVALDSAWLQLSPGTIAFGPGDLLFSSPFAGGNNAIWDTHGMRQVFVFGTNAPPVIARAEFTADGRSLVLLGGTNKIGGNMKIQIWKIENSLSSQPGGHLSATLSKTLDSGSYNGFLLAPDNQHFAFELQEYGSEPKVMIGEIDGQAPPRFMANFSWKSAAAENFAFTPDSRHLLMINTNWEVATLDAVTGEEVLPPLSVVDSTQPNARTKLKISLSPEGTKLAVSPCTGDAGVSIWDWKKRSRLYSLPRQGGGSTSQIAWSSDSQHLAVCQEQSGVAIWNLKEVEQVLNKLALNP